MLKGGESARPSAESRGASGENGERGNRSNQVLGGVSGWIKYVKINFLFCLCPIVD